MLPLAVVLLAVAAAAYPRRIADPLKLRPAPHAALRSAAFDDSDEALERRMAQEVFDELRGGLAEVPVEAFKRWEDVADLIGETALRASRDCNS